MLFFTITAASCMKIRGPGIMPVIDTGAGGEWVLIRESTDPARTGSGEQNLQWRIILQYVPGEDGRRITPTDISVTFDGNRIPFTFEEEDQILETAVTAVFGPSLVHFFVLDPAEESVRLFPSFELVIR
jgi:hypothetical protein